MTDHPLYAEAMQRFSTRFAEVQQSDMKEPSAMTLATVDEQGRPSSRIVLLRGNDERGFVFYTNSHSRKAQQMAAQSHVALCWYWYIFDEQVRAEGTISKVEDSESDTYWERRPRQSQIGAWASDQSAVLDGRETLEQRIQSFEAKFADQPVPRPPHWHGYRVAPRRIEFWEGRDARLHVRWIYEQQDGHWEKFLLYP